MKCKRMKKGTRILLSKSVCFATEILRACLSQPTTNVRLCGLWMQKTMMCMDIRNNGETSARHIGFQILISPNSHVHACCNVYGTGGEWTSGDVEVALLDETGHFNANTQRWYFACKLNGESRIDVRLTQ
jgi:hypothetical protein